MSTKEEIAAALDAFRAALGPDELARRLQITPTAARRIWRAAKRIIVKQRFSPKAALEFAAETDVAFEALSVTLWDHIVCFGGGTERFAGLACLLKQWRDLQTTRIALRRELGLMPGPARPAPALQESNSASLAGQEPTLAELNEEIVALQAERDRLEQVQAARRGKPGAKVVRMTPKKTAAGA